MPNVVYWATNIKPAPIVIVEIGYIMLAEVISGTEIVAQAFANAPRDNDTGHAAGCYQLTDEGIELYRRGISGSPEGFKEWPSDAPLPDFEKYPIDRSASLTVK